MSDLRRIFEGIIREARCLETTNKIRSQQIVALAEEGISRITHSVIETREPFWEEHGPPEDRLVNRRWMVQIGVEGDRFSPHLENEGCYVAGCMVARPNEIPNQENACES